MTLVDMVPSGQLSSTEYVLANPGHEYLVLQPNPTGDAFTVRLDAGRYHAEWYSVTTRERLPASPITVESEGRHSFTAPFKPAGPTVLYLKQINR